METRPKLLSRTEQSVTRFETNYFRHENLRCFSIARIINNNTQLARFRFSTKTKFPSSVYSPNFLSLPSVKSDRFAKIRCASRLSNRKNNPSNVTNRATLSQRDRERERRREFPIAKRANGATSRKKSKRKRGRTERKQNPVNKPPRKRRRKRRAREEKRRRKEGWKRNKKETEKERE